MADFRTEFIAFCVGQGVLAAMAPARQGRDLPFAFNRREAKSHGGGGDLIGAPLAGRVLVRDDVVAASREYRQLYGIAQHA